MQKQSKKVFVFIAMVVLALVSNAQRRDSLCKLRLPSTSANGTGYIFINGWKFVNAFDSSGILPGQLTNVFLGQQDGNDSTTSFAETGTGYQALQNIGRGTPAPYGKAFNNSAYGVQSQQFNRAGFENSTFGPYNLQYCDSPVRNIMVGVASFQFLAHGRGYNIGIGNEQAGNCVNCDGNIYIGDYVHNPAGDESDMLRIGRDSLNLGTSVYYAIKADLAGRVLGTQQRMVVNVGSDPVTTSPSAILQVNGTNGGILPPRLTTTQKNAIPSPMPGTTVYDTTLNQMSYWNGTSWVNF